MEYILELNQWLFNMINGTWYCRLLDSIMPLVRNKYFWLPFYAFIFSFLIVNFGKKGLLVILVMIVMVGITDYISSKLIKPWIGWPRPCQDVMNYDTLRLLVNCPKSFSFPSSHAANHFMAAIYLALLAGRKRLWAGSLLLLWAASISYAQIYVGVHYPLDVLFGAMLGGFIGYYSYNLTQRLFSLKYFASGKEET